MHPSSRARLVGARACALGGVATTMGVLGHVHAGGASPDLPQVLAVWLLASVFSSAFLLRQAGWLRIAALLLVEQLALHVALMSWVGGASMPGMGAMPGMAMPMPSMSMTPSTSMVVAHALAAALAGVWLWQGECALWSLLALAREALSLLWRPVAVVPVPAAPTNLRSGLEVRPWWELQLARAVPLRGPPAPMAQ